MLRRLDHTAYVARDLNEGVETLRRALGLEVTREFELPQFSLRGVFLGRDAMLVEVFELLSLELAERRLAGLALRLDHVAYDVASIDVAASTLSALGVRFGGPDGVEVDEPIELGGRRHLWTLQDSGPLALSLQLVER
jgi:catechol 2,3-dioxygenase-like lactoylglutathione lyase family enzyme